MITTMKGSLMLALLAFTALTPAAFSQDLNILVNLPAYRLDVYQGDEHVRSYPIATGSPTTWRSAPCAH